MATKRLPRPRDPLALAKLIGDIATGQRADVAESGKDQARVESGRRGGEIGGKSRAQRLTAEQRRAAAKKAAAARWHSRKAET
jgi:hypothetical protein